MTQCGHAVGLCEGQSRSVQGRQHLSVQSSVAPERLEAREEAVVRL